MKVCTSKIRKLGLGLLLLVPVILSAQPLGPGEDGIMTIPKMKAWASDYSNTLNASDLAALNQKLTAFKKEKGSQIAVMIVNTTAPETIEGYSIRVAEEWKVGRKGVDDGVLLLVAKKDRKLRIEVGYGLEGAIPDARAKQIIEDYIVPKFKSGDFTGGINIGVDNIMKLIRGEELPEHEETESGSGGDMNGLWSTLFFMGIFISAAMPWKVRLIGASIAGVLFLLISTIFFSMEFLFAFFVGIILWLIIVVGGSVMGQRGGSGGYSGGGFSSGGGGFSGGGFSGGGGGSFGGGGSSGSW